MLLVELSCTKSHGTLVCIRFEKCFEHLHIYQSVHMRTTSHRGGRGSIQGQIMVGSVADKMALGRGFFEYSFPYLLVTTCSTFINGPTI
jgi:hypothetical protein